MHRLPYLIDTDKSRMRSCVLWRQRLRPMLCQQRQQRQVARLSQAVRQCFQQSPCLILGCARGHTQPSRTGGGTRGCCCCGGWLAFTAPCSRASGSVLTCCACACGVVVVLPPARHPSWNRYTTVTPAAAAAGCVVVACCETFPAEPGPELWLRFHACLQERQAAAAGKRPLSQR